jgi:hypothetical protein
MNQCGVCGEDFSSVRLFDVHRVGRHEYLFGAEHLDGRRCLEVEEMRELGWELNVRGRWCDPVRSRDAASRFSVSVT